MFKKILEFYGIRWVKVVVNIFLSIIILFGALLWFVNIRFYGTPSTEVWMENKAYDEKNVTDLQMKEGQDFKILVLSDIQLETDPRKDFRTLKFLKRIVGETKPDFIVTTGDNASWYFSELETKRLIRNMEQFNILWGVTLGNHDSEGRADRAAIGNLYEQAKNSVFKQGPSNIHGIGNYSVNLKDPQGNIIYELIMMDSNIKRLYDLGEQEDFIYYDQIKWYEWIVKGVSEARYGEHNPDVGKFVPSMLFFHIPIPEFNQAEEAAKRGQEGSFGINREGEGWSSPLINTGLFDSVKKLNSTTHIFCGHHHNNSLSAIYDNVRLTFGLKSGYSAYYSEDMNGGTLITVKSGSHHIDVEHVYLLEN